MNNNDIAIKVENLSKRYRIGLKEEMHDSIGSAIIDFIKTPWRNYRKYRSLYKFDNIDSTQDTDSGNNSSDIIWAVRDVSFEVKEGEVLGIIGKNGAGKSTLLKIISKITDPTGGQIRIRGRVSSLLEVGTGFHPELTGRENVYLNGTILGMTKNEIDKKFDQIVDFSGIEKFIDTPVKRYSSGMKVRLAFSVAAHLEPDVLIIDEVLAVGDARFQKKCLSKMKEVGKQGRTVLFVSHNMAAVKSLCDRVILLGEGGVIQDGLPQMVISTYLNSELYTSAFREWPDPIEAPGGEVARLRAVRVRSEDGCIVDNIDIRNQISVEMEYDVLKSGYVLLPNFYFWNAEWVCIFGAQDLDPTWRRRPRPEGRYISTVHIPGNFLADGMIYVNVNLNIQEPHIVQFHCPSAVAFEVIDSLDGDTARGDFTYPMQGIVRPLLRWNTQYNSNEHVEEKQFSKP